jgi:hypothetical protein
MALKDPGRQKLAVSLLARFRVLAQESEPNKGEPARVSRWILAWRISSLLSAAR